MNKTEEMYDQLRLVVTYSRVKGKYKYEEQLKLLKKMINADKEVSRAFCQAVKEMVGETVDRITKEMSDD